jgi:predicted dehydrogenase
MKNDSQSSRRRISRRSFLGNATVAASAFTILPRSVMGGAGTVGPNDKINLACIGVGSQGTRVMMDFLKQPDVQVVATCDVSRESSDYVEWGANEIRDKVRALLGPGYSNWGADWKGPTCGREPAKRIVEAYYATKSPSGKFQGCASYNDYRELLDVEKGVDACLVCTADHWHALIAIAAMKAGKNVYCQKPMTHSVVQARKMGEVASQTKVATQVAIGNQASESTRLLEEWVAAGVIGPVRRVENWSSRPFWPQGINRPDSVDPVTEGLDWDLWLGPAPYRPFNKIYQPFVWRGWFDFGCGAIGDMGCYSFDTIFRVLKLQAPEAVEATSTKVFPETYPEASIIHFYFPARGSMPPVEVNWYDGGLVPPRPDGVADDYVMAGEDHEGLLFIGDNGTIMCGFNGARPRLLPPSRMKTFQPPPKTLPRSPGNDREWLNACKGATEKPGANFEFEAGVTEAIQLGNIALRVGKKIHWDAANFKITNDEAANKLLDCSYRGDFKI